MNNNIIDDILDEINRYQEAGNMPTAIIMNDKDAKTLFGSMYIRNAIVSYESVRNITLGGIKIYRTIDIDRNNFKII